MKIAFSTLGCPGWSWDEILATAKDLGFNGIELRGIENELYVPKAAPFAGKNLEHTRERLNALALEVPCLTSSCFLFDSSKIDFYLNEGKEYIDLAQKLGAGLVRVLGDSSPEPLQDIDVNFVAGNLSVLAKYAEGKNVKVLVETNGVFSSSGKMRELLQKADHPNIGVLWDIHHPFRYMNEAVHTTYTALKGYIDFVHVKDSVLENGKARYRMMGYGDVPVSEALGLLKDDGYKGYISLEWVKRWCIDLEDPGIVFSHFVNYVKKTIR